MVENTRASTGNFLYHLNPDLRKIIRRLERLHLKILKRKYSAVFNRTCLHTHTHTHTHIYIYWQHFFIHTYLIEHNRHFLSTYFFVNPFELPYWSYDIRWELVDNPSIISYFPSTFCPTLDDHQGRMYYKSDVIFVCTLLLCKNERLYFCIV